MKTFEFKVELLKMGLVMGLTKSKCEYFIGRIEEEKLKTLIQIDCEVFDNRDYYHDFLKQLKWILAQERNNDY